MIKVKDYNNIKKILYLVNGSTNKAIILNEKQFKEFETIAFSKDKSGTYLLSQDRNTADVFYKICSKLWRNGNIISNKELNKMGLISPKEHKFAIGWSFILSPVKKIIE